MGGEIEQEDFPRFTCAQEKEGVNNENTMHCSISVIIRADRDGYLLFQCADTDQPKGR